MYTFLFGFILTFAYNNISQNIINSNVLSAQKYNNGINIIEKKEVQYESNFHKSFRYFNYLIASIT